jgi:NitT/TauT family transport system substrate-binding protein
MKRVRILHGRALIAAALIAGMTATGARAEVGEVRIAEQFGIAYLPLMMMREKGLVEKHAKKAGLGDIKVTWARFGGGAPMNDALLSGNLDFATGGVGPLLTIWSKTKGGLDVRGAAARPPRWRRSAGCRSTSRPRIPT